MRWRVKGYEIHCGGKRKREAFARADTFNYAQYKAQQFDRLADAMRRHIDIERINHIVREHREE